MPAGEGCGQQVVERHTGRGVADEILDLARLPVASYEQRVLSIPNVEDDRSPPRGPNPRKTKTPAASAPPRRRPTRSARSLRGSGHGSFASSPPTSPPHTPASAQSSKRTPGTGETSPTAPPTPAAKIESDPQSSPSLLIIGPGERAPKITVRKAIGSTSPKS